MAFYKYGISFLAGTGFGAVVSSVRRDACPLRRQQHCRRHLARGHADDEPERSTARCDECVRRRQEEEESDVGTRRPKKGGGNKEKKKRDFEESE